jgi:nicotinamidase-related amidase
VPNLYPNSFSATEQVAMSLADASKSPASNTPDREKSCLLIIDMINPFSFPDATKMFPTVVIVAGHIAKLKRRAQAAGVPAIYVNDNFGKWQHDLRTLVESCLHEECPGRPVTEALEPDKEDYFVLKPKHSGFFATPLELLLRFLDVRRLIVTGVSGDNCVLYTAADAYMRDFAISVPRDCIASLDPQSNEYALVQMQTTLKAEVTSSTELQF